MSFRCVVAGASGWSRARELRWKWCRRVQCCFGTAAATSEASCNKTIEPPGATHKPRAVSTVRIPICLIVASLRRTYFLLPHSSCEPCCLRTCISVFSRLDSVLMAMFVLLSCALTGDTGNTRHVVALATRLGSVRQQRCNTSCFGSFFLSAKPISEKRYKVKPQNARPA